MHRVRGGVVLVVDLADQLLDEVLQGDDPGRAAVLVDHHREVLTLPAHLGQRGEHPFAAREPLHLPGQLADGDARVGVRAQQYVTEVHEADHVVVRAVGDRVTGVRFGADQSGGFDDGQPRREEDHLGARHHHLADQTGTGHQDLVDDPTLVRVEHSVRRDQVPQIGLGDVLPAGRRTGPEQIGDESGGAIRGAHQHPGDGPGERARVAAGVCPRVSPEPGTGRFPHDRDGRHRGPAAPGITRSGGEMFGSV
ncbi:hypothetical protein ONO86_01975 [Micromonospora noduli]|nr:hypothetical protein ONO86_01975 [Micromonospora noduli]